jgi:hypothetical protein
MKRYKEKYAGTAGASAPRKPGKEGGASRPPRKPAQDAGKAQGRTQGPNKAAANSAPKQATKKPGILDRIKSIFGKKPGSDDK